MSQVLIDVKDVKKYYPVGSGSFGGKGKRFVKALDGVSFQIHKGETLGVVGESGCGKSTTGRAILRLMSLTEGQVLFEGQDVYALSSRELRSFRKRMQMIFQDPFACLDPRKTVGQIIEHPLQIHHMGSSAERKERVLELMNLVGLRADYIHRYPHEFSGGQRQRIGIGRALALNPSFVVCDEPISALDVSIQGQVINLMQELQEKLSLTYMFISHDLSVVRHICDRIVVMYLGKVIETATKEELYAHPAHPYTQALLSAIPVIGGSEKKRIILEGDIPSPVDVPKGCRFCTRCFAAKEICFQQEPPLQVLSAGHTCACHFPTQ